jgi:RNA polymerase sigma-70 factor, ECF subfamily
MGWIGIVGFTYLVFVTTCTPCGKSFSEVSACICFSASWCLRVCLARNRPGPYQLQAAINAVHSDAPSVERTDWRQILELYDQLMAVAPNAVVALNRAVVVAEVHGVEPALQLVDAIDLPNYHLRHAVRADLLRRLGRTADAASAYRAAVENCCNRKERDFLMRQCQSLTRH